MTLLAVLVVAGCADEGSADQSLTTQTEAAASSTANMEPPSSPSGEPSPPEDGSPSTYEGDASRILGRWDDRNAFRWEFTDQGDFTVQGGSVEVGTYVLDGDVLELDDAQGSPYCAGLHAEYEITFLDGGDVMDLTLIDDPCDVRRDARFGPLRRHDN